MKIGLVQINNSFAGANYLPYTVATLQAYAEKNLVHPGEFEFLLPVYRRVAVDEAVTQLDAADAVFFSTYVWNIRMSLEIARRLKELRPDRPIVFGGPQVPDEPGTFLRQHEFVDLVVHGEGEQSFIAILENLEERDWRKVPSASFLRDGHGLVKTLKVARFRDLEVVPSPFLEGAFAPLMEANPQETWLALWETNRGCPFKCNFCDWGSATGAKVTRYSMEHLMGDMDWFAANRIEFVYCCDANFGILPRDLDIVQYMAGLKERLGYPQVFSVQNTKNATDRAYQVQKELHDAGLQKGVTLGIQSLDPHTLEMIERDNISLETYHELQRRFTRDGVPTYTDLILALPGETYDSFASGVETLINNGQHTRIQFNNLSILPNAEMGDPDYQQRHGFEVVVTKIINMHGSLADEEVPELQDLVVGTDSMPREDWIKARSFAWWAALLHFDKLLQIPFVVLHEKFGLGYRTLIEAFSALPLERYPVLHDIDALFVDKARDIQAGGPEYVKGEDLLGIWWPADEYALIKLFREGLLGDFYAESEVVLLDLLKSSGHIEAERLLADTTSINAQLMRLPAMTADAVLSPTYNVVEVYQAALRGESLDLEQAKGSYVVDRTSKVWETWEDWCQDVVWYQNKTGNYLYTCRPERDLALRP